MPETPAPPPTTIAGDLAELVRLGQAMREETSRLQAEHDAFWRACAARIAAPNIAHAK
jgi:hypothetical protein